MFNELTEVDIKKMKEELEYRDVELRKELIQNLKEAREYGDLSENAEYHIAKREKNRNESRIRYLKRMIATAKIITTSIANHIVNIVSRLNDTSCPNKLVLYTQWCIFLPFSFSV